MPRFRAEGFREGIGFKFRVFKEFWVQGRDGSKFSLAV